MFLLTVSFIAGILTVLAPCVLPLLPVIVGGSLASGTRHRSYVIVGSLAVSIVAFTLLLKASTVLISVPEDFWQYLSGGIITLFGIFLLFPHLWTSIPGVNMLSQSSNQWLSVGYQKGGFWGDALMGAALGPVFASCSPTYFIILATVLPVQPVLGFTYLVAYAAGLSLMLLLIAFAGDKLVQKLGLTIEPRGWFRRGIGLVMLIVGFMILTGVMKQAETWLVERGLNPSLLEYKLLGDDEDMASVVPSVLAETLSPEAKALAYRKAPELVSPDGYINTGGKPITIEEFKGKNPVLIDIWTYSCINCIRTLPYIRAWHETYEKDGLVIIGVHTPEFAFEKVQANVEEAMREHGLTYPVILDNEYQTWHAFENHFWPRKYLIDIDGYIVYDHAGEGDYEETERAIQYVLAERAKRLGTSMPEETADVQDTTKVDFSQVGSPEIYFGAWRNERLGNGEAGEMGPRQFTLPETLSPNILYLTGVWDVQWEYAKSAVPPAGVVFMYDSKDVYMVAASEKPVRMKVTRDGGKSLGEARGEDVDEEGFVTIQEERLYKLIEDDVYETHILELEVNDKGLDIYTFTFG